MLNNHFRNGRNAQQQQQQQRQQHLEIQKKHAKAERIRKLWTEFEQWLKHPRNEMERERDQLLLQPGNFNTLAVRSSRRRIEEAHFSKAREEWQRRLRAADLKESDWDPITEAEMKAVEEGLGVDDEEGYITDPSPSPPHRPLYAASTSSATSLVPAENIANRSASSLIHSPPVILAAPPMTTASRTTSASSSSYECVRPEEFHSDDEESTSDSEFSFSTTISSIISEEDEVVGPVTEYIVSQALETDSSLGVAKESNGPLLARTAPATKPADVATGGQPPRSLAPPKRPPDARQQQQAIVASRSSSNSSNASSSSSAALPKKPSPAVPSQTATTSSTTKVSPPIPSQSAAPIKKPSPPVTTTSASSSSSKSQQSSKPPRIHYPLVAPSLSDQSDYDEVENDAETDRLSPSLVAQLEAQFEVRKLEIRIEKIKQFHDLAAQADIELSITIADGRRDRTLSRQDEADFVQEHYERTLALRERMEKERKEQVNGEKKRLREEFSWHSSNLSQRQAGLLQQQQHFPQQQPPVESDPEDDKEDEMQKMFERMRQEQLAMQAKFNSHVPPKTQTTRKRASTLTLDSMPSPLMAMNDKHFDESNEVSTPRPASKGGSAWSVKPPATRSLADVLSQNLSRRTASPLFEPVVQQQQPPFVPHEVENGDVGADHDDADNESERESTGFWSYLTSSSKKKAANVQSPQPPQSPWNFASPPATKPLQKPANAKSRLGIVTSAWDDDFAADEREPVEEPVADREEKEELPQEKTPVIPSAPAPNVSPTNKKQTKKQRQANKKGGAAGAASSAATAKADKAEVTPVQVSPSSSKTAPVGVPGKPGRKSSLTGAENDDISSTPRPSALKRLQAQLANEGTSNEQEDQTPMTPRPAPAKKGAAAQASNPWARGTGKVMNKNAVDHVFDDDVAVETTSGATSSRTMLGQMNGKKTAEAIPSSPQVPGAWTWGGATTSNDKGKAPVDTPSAAPGARKNGTARQAPASAVDNMESNKKKGKKAQRTANGNANLNSASNAWLAKKTTVEEVPDDEDDELQYSSQTEKLPYNSRSILEERGATPLELDEQPRIHEPRPSKPRAVFENIFQYGEAAPAPDPGLVHDLRDELSWTDERIAQAVARMAQESAEMERKVNGLNGMNGHPSSSGPGPLGNGVAGKGMNGVGAVNMANMSRVSMASSMNGSGVVASNGFGLSKPVQIADAAATVKKQVRWQSQPQSQPSSLGGFDDHPRSQPQPQGFVNKMTVPRSYEDEAFSPLANTNGGFSGFQSYAPYGGRNTKTNGVGSGLSQFGSSGNSFDGESEGDDLDRAARNFFENIHVSVGPQQRNKPGFAAV